MLNNTTRLTAQTDAAGGVANANVLLHARPARTVIDSLNSTAAIVEHFQAPLGIEPDRDTLSVMPWREAFREPERLKVVGEEVAQKALIGAGTAGTLVSSAAVVLGRNGPNPGASGSATLRVAAPLPSGRRSTAHCNHEVARSTIVRRVPRRATVVQLCGMVRIGDASFRVDRGPTLK